MPTESSTSARVAMAMLWIAVCAFVVVSLAIGPHVDDLQVFESIDTTDWGAIWTTPFKRRFYRPLTVSIVKLSSTGFGCTVLPLHVLQGGLIFATVALFRNVATRDHHPTTRALASLCLLASPMTFVSVTLFGVGVADTIVALCFLAAVAISARADFAQRTWLFAIPIALVALASKESGVLVPGYVATALIVRRRFAFAAAIALLAVGYVGFRSAVVTGGGLVFKTGFGTAMLTTDQLHERFDGHMHWLYGYNVASNLSTTVLYVPIKGQLRFKWVNVVPMLVFAGTTITWVRFVWRRVSREVLIEKYVPLLAIIPLNAVLGYSYVRTRIMFVAYVAIALLFSDAIHDLWRKNEVVWRIRGRTLTIVSLVGWALMYLGSLAALRVERRINEKFAPAARAAQCATLAPRAP